MEKVLYIPAFGTLSDDCLSLLYPLGTLTPYQEGAIIHERGEKKPGLSVVSKGAVRVGNYGLDGRYIQTTLFGPGDSFGEFTLFSNLPRTHTAEAVGETEVVHITAPVFEQAIADHPKLAMGMLASLSTRLHWALEVMDDMLRMPLPVRLSKLIYAFYQAAEGSEILHITQEQLAERAGVSRVSISAALKKLEAQGLVRRRYNELEICDVAGLKLHINQSQQTRSLKKGKDSL